jgi:TP901 family phage tail tape measure protein
VDADLIALRIKVLGGKQGAAEVGALNSEVAKTGPVSKQAAAMTRSSARVTSQDWKYAAATMASTGRTMTYGITLPLTAVGVMAIKTATDFSRSMAQVQVATGLPSQRMGSMRDLALEMGAKTIFSANESAEAMLELAKSGISPAKIEAGALASTMALAATEQLALGRTAEIVGAAMNTFKIPASESARIADALAGGANASSASVGGLAESLSQGGQSAAMYGLSLEEAVGTLAAFAQNGIQASDAGTSFKTFMMRRNPTQKKQKELMNELNLSFFDQHGKMVGITEVAARLGVALRGMTDEQKGAALQTLFGSDAQRAANIVLREGPAGIERYIKATERKGAAEEMANAQMEGLPGAIERMKGSLETAALVLGEAMAPAIIFVATHLEGLANAFTGLPPEVQSTIAVVGTLAALAGPVLWFAGSMAKAVIAIRELRAAEATGGGMGGKGGLKRLGVGMLGTAAAQVGGNAVGGDLGNWLNMAGTGAATGFMVGGPMGAAVGGAAGGVLAAVQKLTGGEKQLTFQQQRLADSSKSVKEWWGKQRQAAGGLTAADERVRGAHRRTHKATQQMQQAQRHLGAVISEYGSKSRPAIHAEAVLTGKIHAHRRALKQLENAERLRGVALSAYKTATTVTILAERHRINVLTQLRDRQARLFQIAKAANPQSQRTQTLAHNLLGTESKLADATKRHAQTLQDAAQKGGQGYARFLQRANQESLRAGSELKAVTEKAKQLSEAFAHLGEQEVTIPQVQAGPPSFVEPTRKGKGAGHNAAGTAFWRGGPTWLAERGPELVDLPRGARVTAAPATKRLLAAVTDPQPSARVAALAARGGGETRYLVAQPIKVGKKIVAEAVTEAKEDAEARL